MMRKKRVLLPLILLIVLGIGGCGFNIKDYTQRDDRHQLIKVEITFTDDEILTGYVNNLGVDKDGTVYVGGSSLNYLYDKNGNIIGSFNYQRVLYMLIVDEAETD